MEIVKKLQVPADFFYKKVIESVIYEVQDTTGRTLNESQLAGFEYVKKYNDKTSATIKIESAKTNENYAFRTLTTRNDFHVEYQITAIDETSCEVKYTEKMNSNGWIQSMNDMVVGTVLGFLKKRQFKRMLTMIEETY